MSLKEKIEKFEASVASHDVTKALREQLEALSELAEVGVPNDTIPKLQKLIQKTGVLAEKFELYLEAQDPEGWQRAKAELKGKEGGSKT